MALLTATTPAQHQTVLDPPVVGGELPYAIELREISLAPTPIPTLHSAAAAVWQNQWILLAGSTNGLHGLTGNNAFDPQYENREVWVIDPATRQSWRKSLIETSPASGLTADAVDSLSSVNTQFHQHGETLLVAGGYGYKRSAVNHKTYDTLTFIDLPRLVAWVKQAAGSETSRAVDHIRQIQNPYFQVTGGALERLGTEYQLVMGQNYDGRYRPFFNGVYTRQVRRFQVIQGPTGLTVPVDSMIATTPADAYRRRDLNVVMFGGITVLEHNAATGLFIQDNQAPFTNQCGAVVRRADGKFQQYFLPTRFPLIKTTDGKELRFGANAEFFATPGLPRINSKVIDLALIRSDTVIGQIFGGIAADAGNGGNTTASGRVFEVLLRPWAGESKLAIRHAGQQATLTWQGIDGCSYLLETSDDLATWHETVTPIVGLPQVMEWSEPITQPRRFYRLLEGRQSRPPPP